MARPPTRARIKKRLFVIAGIALAVIALLAGMLSWLLSSLIGPANLFRFQIDALPDSRNILGTGINLDQAPPSNFIRDASFEPLVFKHALTLFGSEKNILTVSSEEASSGLFGDGFFNGATARILSDTQGSLIHKQTATVTHYGINRVGPFQPLLLPTDIQPGRAALDFVRKGQQSVAVGQDGLVIRNVTGQTLQSGNSGLTADLTGVCALSNGFLAVSDQGDVIWSTDGMAWTSWMMLMEARLTAVAASDHDMVAAIGLDGTILAGSDGYLNPVLSGTDRDLRSIAFGQSSFVAAGDDGVLLHSRNGLVWEIIPDTPETDWQSVIFRDGRFLVVGTNGQVGLSDDGRTFSFLTVDAALDYVDAIMLSVQQLILLDSDGRFYISNDSGRSWQRSGIETEITSRRIDLIGNDKILSADEKGRLSQAQIIAEIVLDSAIAGQDYQAGDICILEISKATVPDNYLGSEAQRARQNDPWQIMGNATGERTRDEAAPSGGTAAMRLTAGGNGETGQQDVAILSQRIDPALILNKPRNQVYRIELFMRQDQIVSRSVMAWVSGPFSPVGTQFENVGGAFRKYTFTFVLPAESLREQDDVRFNIAFHGPGTLLLDRVYFGPSTNPYPGIDKTFADSVIAASPAIIRLPMIGIGSRAIATDAFAWSAGNAQPGLGPDGYGTNTVLSAATALDLCITADASPYLVIDSFSSETEVMNLMEYLCAPISENFGQQRMDSGRAAPYSEAFNRIFVEIGDPEDLLSGDQRKASYVNLMIRTIEQSPYYRLVKGKLVFVDGMDYQDGVLLSRADYHASDLTALLSEDPVLSIDEAFLSYLDQIPRTPDRAESTPSEIMRSARVDARVGTNLRMADLVSILVRDLGVYTSMSCLDTTPGLPNETNQMYVSAVREVSAAARGGVLAVSRMTEPSGSVQPGNASAAAPDEQNHGQSVQVYAYSSEQNLSILLVNQGSAPAIVQLSTLLPITPATVRKFDEAGHLLSTQKLRSPSSRINVLPGGIAVIVTAQEDQGG